jgi:hypothetical protein
MMSACMTNHDERSSKGYLDFFNPFSGLAVDHIEYIDHIET